MASFLQKKELLFVYCIVIVSCFLFPVPHARAQGSVSITVTPPLFQLTIKAGEEWASTLKVVNTNPRDLTIYAAAMDFEASGEGGNGKFIPLPESLSAIGEMPRTLAGWISVPSEPVTISQGQGANIPFRVRIPSDAEPGGHYAAILVGTQPPRGIGENQILISSFVSSLLFVRIPGDIRETGDIREFSVPESIATEPKVAFTLRFENTGNVHLQPQGDIAIYDLWGRERGKLFLNHKSEFGNALPQSVRKYNPLWEFEGGLLATGRYTAVATISFGNESRQNESATLYFWYLPLRQLSLAGGFLLLLAILGIVTIRRYVRAAIRRERLR